MTKKKTSKKIKVNNDNIALVQTRISAELLAGLEAIATSEGRTIASLLRVLISKAVSKHKLSAGLAGLSCGPQQMRSSKKGGK